MQLLRYQTWTQTTSWFTIKHLKASPTGDYINKITIKCLFDWRKMSIKLFAKYCDKTKHSNYICIQFRIYIVAAFSHVLAQGNRKGTTSFIGRMCAARSILSLINFGRCAIWFTIPSKNRKELVAYWRQPKSSTDRWQDEQIILYIELTK